MTAITLKRINQARNMSRFYSLDVQPTLFGGWSLIREWGRLGRPGRVCTQMFHSRGKADIALVSIWTQKLKKGYH